MISLQEQKKHTWYALYTRPRFEMKVKNALDELGITTFLPMVKTTKLWSDRKKVVDEPLFKSYIFVHITPKEYILCLQTLGVVKFVTSERKAIVVPEQHIAAISLYLTQNEKKRIADETFEAGDKVEVISGAMQSLKGELVSHLGKQKVLIYIETVNQKLPIKISSKCLKKIEN